MATIVPEWGIDFSTLTKGQGGLGAHYRMYAQSKVATMLFTQELDRRLTQHKKYVYCVSVYPGMFVDSGITSTLTGWEGQLYSLGVNLMGLSADDAALTSLYAATNPEAVWRHGDYLTTVAFPIASSQASYNVTTRMALWRESDAIAKRILGPSWAPSLPRWKPEEDHLWQG